MADVKWIKIVTDIFDDEKILLIENMPEADAMIVIWFKLLTLAGKINNGGVLLLNNKIPYTDEMLATIFRRPVNTVRLAINTFEKFGMIEVINDTITIPNWSKHQNLDQLEQRSEYMKNYMREYRERQKLLASNECKPNSKVNGKPNGKVNVSEAEEELDKDKELDIDIKDKDICTEPEVSMPEKMQAEKIFISLPLNDKTEHEVKESEVDTWKELYPAVNIEQELRNMKGWLNANPSKRKTKRGINRFINSWLSRAQDKGGGKNNGLHNGTNDKAKGKPEIYDYDKFFD